MKYKCIIKYFNNKHTFPQIATILKYLFDFNLKIIQDIEINNLTIKLFRNCLFKNYIYLIENKIFIFLFLNTEQKL